jgi:hypothetical protein
MVTPVWHSRTRLDHGGLELINPELSVRCSRYVGGLAGGMFCMITMEWGL